MKEFFLIQMKSEKACLFTDVCHLAKTQMTVYGVWFPSGHVACACVYRAVIISHLPGQNWARRGLFPLYPGWRSFAICVCWGTVRFHSSWMVGSAQSHSLYKFINCTYIVCRLGGKSDWIVWLHCSKKWSEVKLRKLPRCLFWNSW